MKLGVRVDIDKTYLFYKVKVMGSKVKVKNQGFMKIYSG